MVRALLLFVHVSGVIASGGALRIAAADPRLQLSLDARIVFGFAVLFLMVAKPGAAESTSVLAIAAAVCVVLSRMRAIAQRGGSALAPSAR